MLVYIVYVVLIKIRGGYEIVGFKVFEGYEFIMWVLGIVFSLFVRIENVFSY